MTVGMSNCGSVLPAQPILVYPVPLSMTQTFFDRISDNYDIDCNKIFLINLKEFKHVSLQNNTIIDILYIDHQLLWIKHW